jgi:hypothetical protein
MLPGDPAPLLAAGWPDVLQFTATTASVRHQLASRFQAADLVGGPDQTNREAARIALLDALAEWNGPGALRLHRNVFGAHHLLEIRAFANIIADGGGGRGDLWDAPACRGEPAQPCVPVPCEDASIEGGCGDAVIDAGELCDGGSLPCETAGLGAGIMRCLPDCSGFDTSDCGGHEAEEPPADPDPEPPADRVFVGGSLTVGPGAIQFSEWVDKPHAGPLRFTARFEIPAGRPSSNGALGLIYMTGLERHPWPKGSVYVLMHAVEPAAGRRANIILRAIGPDHAKEGTAGGAEAAPKDAKRFRGWTPSKGGIVEIDGIATSDGVSVTVTLSEGGRSRAMHLDVQERLDIDGPGLGLQCGNLDNVEIERRWWDGVTIKCGATSGPATLDEEADNPRRGTEGVPVGGSASAAVKLTPGGREKPAKGSAEISRPGEMLRGGRSGQTASRFDAPGTPRTAQIFAAAAGSPLTLPPSPLWGGLEPLRVLVDSTGVTGEPGDAPHPHQGAVAGDRLCFATGQGILCFDVSDPARPRLLPGFGNASNQAPSWFHSDLDFFMNTIAMASPGVAATGAGSQGFVIWDVDRFTVHYQDAGRAGGGVAAISRSSGRDYAVVSTPGGLALYDLTAAAGLNRCLDDGADSCGVFRGLLPGAGAVAHASGELFVTMDGPAGVRLYELGDPAGFASLSPHLTGTLPGSHGMAVLYRRGERLFLVALGSRFDSRMRSFVWIYDITGAAAVPPPVAQYEVTDRMRALNRQTFLSLVGGRYLYVGNVNVGLPGFPGTTCVEQREHLIDLGRFDPAAPQPLGELDLFPPAYGGHFYQECGGFRGTMPRFATGKDGVLYLSGWSHATAHQIVPGLLLPAARIFADGFETGDMSRWRG